MIADDWHEQDSPQNAVNRFGCDDDEPDEEGPDQYDWQAHFNNTSSITTGVLALIECFKLAGM